MPFIAPIVGAVAGAIGAVGSFLVGAAGTFLGKLAIGIGLNLAASALMKKGQQAPEPTGVKIQTEFGSDVPRQVACGLVGIAGHECHVNTYGDDNGWLQDVYQLSDYPCTSLERVAINGEWVTLGTEDPEKGFIVTSGEYANLAYVKFYDGTQTAADPALVANANPSDRWTSKCVGVGCAYVIVTAKYDREKTVGMPDVFFEFKGAPLYDWRKDDTVGGTGPHRLNDPSTHEYNDNPVVIDFNYCVGFSINGDLFCGMQMDPSDLPLDKFTAAANVCDELVEGERRYRCSVLLDCTATHGENIQSIMKTCGGVVIDAPDGSWPMIGAAQPVVATITDDDLVVGEPVSWQAKRSMSELVNSISGTHPDPDQLWAMVGYEPIVLDAAIVVDRRTRDLVMDFPTVHSARQAKQLASIYASENRLEATAEITLRPRWQTLKAGDWITWASARYGTRTYIITENTLYSLDSKGPRNNRISLQERNASIYDAVTPPAPIVTYPPGKPIYLQELANLQVAGVSAGSGDKLMPAIYVSWEQIEDVTVVGVEIEYWPTGQLESKQTKVVSDQETSTLLTDSIVSSTEYQVRTRLITSPQRIVAWTAPKAVTTPNQPFTDIDREGIREDFNEASAWLRYNTREELERAIANATADIGDFDTQYSNIQRLRRDLTVTYQNAKASWEEEIEVATGPDSALARRQETLEAALTGYLDADAVASAFSAAYAIIDTNSDAIEINTADLTQVKAALNGYLDADAMADAVSLLNAGISANADGITANSNAIIQTTAAVGEVSASGTFRAQSYASPGDSWARLGLEASADSGVSFETAAIFLDARTTGTPRSRIMLDAEQVVIGKLSSPATVYRPFVITEGKLYADELYVDYAKIENVNIGWAEIGDAVVNNLVIGSANIGDLVVGTSNLAFGAVTQVVVHDYATTDVNNGNAGDWITRYTFTVDNEGGFPLFWDVEVNMFVRFTGASGGWMQLGFQFVNTTSGEEVLFERVIVDTGGGKTENATRFLIEIPPGSGVNTYALKTARGWNSYAQPNEARIQPTLKAIYWKR